MKGTLGKALSTIQEGFQDSVADLGLSVAVNLPTRRTMPITRNHAPGGSR